MQSIPEGKEEVTCSFRLWGSGQSDDGKSGVLKMIAK